MVWPILSNIDDGLCVLYSIYFLNDRLFLDENLGAGGLCCSTQNNSAISVAYSLQTNGYTTLFLDNVFYYVSEDYLLTVFVLYLFEKLTDIKHVLFLSIHRHDQVQKRLISGYWANNDWFIQSIQL